MHVIVRKVYSGVLFEHFEKNSGPKKLRFSKKLRYFLRKNSGFRNFPANLIPVAEVIVSCYFKYWPFSSRDTYFLFQVGKKKKLRTGKNKNSGHFFKKTQGFRKKLRCLDAKLRFLARYDSWP